MFNWLFQKPAQEKLLERDAIRAGAEDEVWQMRQKSNELMKAIEAVIRKDMERKSQ